MQGGAEHLSAAVRPGRHLQGHVRGLVLHPLRDLLAREPRLGEEKVCPDCGRPVEWVKEESYFFRMSKYARPLLEHIEANPDFIQPESRRNEVVSFIKQRPGGPVASPAPPFDWGIPVPFDPKHVVYVWIDALTNYLTGVGYLQDDEQFAKWWPADCPRGGQRHPPLPHDHLAGDPDGRRAAPAQAGVRARLAADGHRQDVQVEGERGRPHPADRRFGADAIRYFLLREVAFGQDARYNTEALIERINSDLANDLGNGLHRSIAMLRQILRREDP